MDLEKIYKQSAQQIAKADAILITAGAGIGVDSGLPDFRGPEGFWRAYPAIKHLGIRFEEMANPYWFKKDPQLAWAFYGHRLNLYRKTKPHKGFQILLDIGNSKKFGYFVFTSNVDGQFQKANFDPNKIVEVHGSIHYLQCSVPCSNEIWSADKINIKIDEKNFKAIPPLPKCPFCGQIARPNILMFNDWDWIDTRFYEQYLRMNNWLDTLLKSKANLVIIEIGAGKAVPTVRMKSEQIAITHNALIIRINPRDYDVPSGHISIPTGALQALEGIQKFLN